MEPSVLTSAEKDVVINEGVNFFKWAIPSIAASLVTFGGLVFKKLWDAIKANTAAIIANEKSNQEQFHALELQMVGVLERLKTLDKLDTIIESLLTVERISEYLHAIKGATSFQDHVKRQLKRRESKIKRIVKNAGK